MRKTKQKQKPNTISGSFQYKQAVPVSEYCDKCYNHQIRSIYICMCIYVKRSIGIHKGANTPFLPGGEKRLE